MAGAYPGSPDPSDARRKIRWLLERGIRGFVDLTEEGERTGRGAPLLPYEHLLAAEAEREGVAAEYVRYPIEDLGVPSPEQMQRILERLEEGGDPRGPVYVHCLGGRGRTGTVVACCLLRLAKRSGRPLAAEEALAELTALRQSQGIPDPWDSPQTSVQFEFVKTWAEREA